MRYLPLIGLLCLLACTADPSVTSTPGPVYERLDNAAFAARRAALPDAPLLDVRTPTEYAAGHLDGAMNVDVRAADFAERVAKLPKDRPVLVYCQAGGRSARACTAMQEMGFTEVYELQDGYRNWPE